MSRPPKFTGDIPFLNARGDPTPASSIVSAAHSHLARRGRSPPAPRAAAFSGTLLVFVEGHRPHVHLACPDVRVDRGEIGLGIEKLDGFDRLKNSTRSIEFIEDALHQHHILRLVDGKPVLRSIELLWKLRPLDLELLRVP